MQTFLIEGSFSTEQRLPFSRMPSRGRPEKNKYTANNLPCVKPCSFSAQRCGVYLFNVSLRTKVIFCPTHKYIRLYTEKSSPLVYADILNFRINFVIFEQFCIFPLRKHKNSPSLYKEGLTFICHQHAACCLLRPKNG